MSEVKAIQCDNTGCQTLAGKLLVQIKSAHFIYDGIELKWENMDFCSNECVRNAADRASYAERKRLKEATARAAGKK